jgi:hypothetical protein
MTDSTKTGLFAPKTEAAPTTPPPPAQPDFFSIFARHKFGLNPEWRIVLWSTSPDHVPEGFIKLEGAVMPQKRGGGRSWRPSPRRSARIGRC